MNSRFDEICENSIFIREALPKNAIEGLYANSNSFDGCSKALDTLWSGAKKTYTLNKDHQAICSILSFLENHEHNTEVEKTASKKISFLEVLYPLGNYFLKELQGQKIQLKTPVLYNLKDQLLEYLSWLSSYAIYADYIQYSISIDKKDYIKYCSDDARLLDLFTKYPVLARLCSRTVISFVENVSTLITRLEADENLLKTLVQKNCSVCIKDVIDLQLGLSDRHHNGQTVCIIDFGDNNKIVYKPRSVAMEEQLSNLASLLNEKLSSGEIYAYQVIERGEYGWVEFIDYEECSSANEIKQYYYNSGLLLFLTHILNGTDCHDENILAKGKHPVLIDAETLFHPSHSSVLASDQDAAYFLGIKELTSSVLRTGWLPSWQFGGGVESAYETGAIGAEGEHSSPYKIETWQNVGKDSISFKYEKKIIRSESRMSVPSLYGQRIGISEYVPDLVEGYLAMGKVLQEIKGSFIKSIKSSNFNKNQKSRFIFRDTSSYALLLKHNRTKEALKDGFSFSKNLEKIAAPTLNGDRDNLKEIISAELKSLYKLDVPYFTVGVNEHHLLTKKNNRFPVSSLEEVISRIKNLKQRHVEKNSHIIWQVLYASMINDGHITTHGESNIRLPIEAFETTKIHKEVEILLDNLLNTAIEGKDGSITWVAAQSIPLTKKYQIQPLSSSLYEGLCGLAIAFTAAGEALNKDNYYEIAKRILKGVAEYSEEKNENEFLGGVGYGLGSALYTASIIHQIKKGIVRKSEVINVLEKMTDKWIDDQREVDVINGLSGTLLSLLKCYEVYKIDLALTKAESITNRLLAMKDTHGNLRWLSNSEKRELTGFSHGNSGILRALSLGNKYYPLDAIEDILTEKGLEEMNGLDPDVGQWKDPRVPDDYVGSHEEIYKSTWCYGAPGIGLAMIKIYEDTKLKEIKEIADICVEATSNILANEPDYIDHLCCGNLGRIEYLFEYGRVTDNPHFLKKAEQYLSLTIMQAKERGGYRLTGIGPGKIINPGLFQGTSGIVYQLLRLSNQNSLPSICSFS